MSRKLSVPVAVARKVDVIIIDGVKLIEYGINENNEQVKNKNLHVDRKGMFQEIANSIFVELRISVDGMFTIMCHYFPKYKNLTFNLILFMQPHMLNAGGLH